MFQPLPSPVLGFSIVDARSEKHVWHTDEGRSHLEIDIFPGRISLAEGVSLEDFVLSVICQEFNPDRGWIWIGREVWNDTYDTPMGSMTKNGMVVAYEDQPRACRITVDDKAVHLPDGRSFPRDGFRPFHTLHPMLRKSRDDCAVGFGAALADQPYKQILVGALTAGLPAAFDDPTRMARMRLLAGRLARLIEMRGTTSGRAAMERAIEDIKEIDREFCSAWLIRPDRGWAPRQLIADPLMTGLRDQGDPRLHDLGARLLAIVSDEVDPEIAKVLETDNRVLEAGLSAHQKMQVLRLRRKFAAELEAAVPLDLLKPAARKRQEKLRAV